MKKASALWSKYRKNIHWIDIVLLSLFGLGLAVVFIFFRRDSTLVTARFKVTDNNALYAEHNPRNEFAHAFQEGSVEKDELGQVVARIANVDAYALNKEEQVVYLDIEVKALHNPNKNQFTMRGRPLVYGQPFTFTFDTVKVEAILVRPPTMDTLPSHAKAKTLVKAQLRWEDRNYSDTYGVPPYVADKIKVGDEVKNSQGETMAKVKEVEISPAMRWVISDGRQVLIQDQYLKDVFYTLEVATYEINGQRYMFDYIPLLVGDTIPLNFPGISVFPTVTEIL